MATKSCAVYALCHALHIYCYLSDVGKLTEPGGEAPTMLRHPSLRRLAVAAYTFADMKRLDKVSVLATSCCQAAGCVSRLRAMSVLHS